MALAWLAHLYTALGATTALASAVAVHDGDLRAAFLWLALAVIIDATDGALARAVDVRRHLPDFDGARLDDIVDYLTYVFVPALIVVYGGIVPGPWGLAVATAMLVSSGYGFVQPGAKGNGSEYYFSGFPSYWNIAAFYLHVWGLSHAMNAAILLTLAALVFVPIRYVYPSRTPTLRPLTITLGILWGVVMAVQLWQLPVVDARWSALSVVFPVYYFALSFVLYATGRGERSA